MKELVFIQGGGIRRVFIEGRTISFLTAELGFTPLKIDLDKLEEEETKKKVDKMQLDKKVLKELAKLKTEEDMIKDVTKDFQQSGWRRVKNE